jgi:hypothetical protein
MTPPRRPNANLSKEETWLMQAVIQQRQPELLSVVGELGKIPLSDVQRESLRNVLADELMATGLTREGDINARGLKLDNLIGQLTFL